MASRDQTIQFSLLAKDLASGKFKNASKELKGMEAASSRVGGAFGKMGSAVASAGRVAFDIAKKAAIGLGAALAASVTRAAQFEKAMLNVNSIAKVGERDFEAMKAQVIDLTRVVPQSATVLAEGLYDIQSSGFAGKEGMKVLEAAAKGASAGLTDTSVSAKGLTAILNAYGKGAEQAAGVTDLMFKVVDRGVISFEELANTIGTTTALSAPLGVELEEVGAALALMTRKGIDAANATTQINAIMANLLKPSKEAADLAQELGLGWDAAALRAKGLTGVLEDMIKATGGNEEQMATLLGDARAIRGAFVLAADGGKEFTAELEVMRGALGATDTALSYQKQGLAFQLGILKNNVDAIAISIGSALLPKITPIVQGISEWFQANEVLIGQVTGALVTGIVSFAERAVRGLSMVVNFVSANWPTISAVAQTVFDRLSAAANWVTHNVLPPLRAAFESIGAWFHANGAQIGEMFGAMWGAGHRAVSAVYPLLESLAREILPLIGPAFTASIPQITAFFEAVGRGIERVQAFVTAATEMRDKVHAVLDRMWISFRILGLNVAAWATGLVADIRGFVAGALEALAQIPGPLQETTRQAAVSMRALESEARSSAAGMTANVEQLTKRWRASFKDMTATLARAAGETDGWTGRIASVAARNLSSVASRAGAWGFNVGASFAAGLRNSAYLATAASQMIAAAGGSSLRGYSPPREGPLKDIDKWGLNIGRTWAESLGAAGPSVWTNAMGLASTAARALGTGFGARPMMAQAYSSPASSHSEVHYHVTVEGDLRAESKEDVVAALARLSALSNGGLA